MKAFPIAVIAVLIASGAWLVWQSDFFGSKDSALALRERLLMSEVRVPNISEPIALGERKNDGTESFIGGEYQSDEDEFVRAFVSVEDEHAVVLHGSRSVAPWYVIPMYINYGGTGTFLSLGLFSSEGDGLVHHDTIFVGDRVSIESISITPNNEVELHYLTRRSDQGAAAETTVPALFKAVREGTSLLFIRDMVNSTENDVRLTAPVFGSEISSPVVLRGSARGPWYFEAVFSAEVLSESGEVIGEGFVEAEGEWMTESFVPFRGEIELKEGYSGPAVVVLNKANASGLPEMEASVSVPVIVK